MVFGNNDQQKFILVEPLAVAIKEVNEGSLPQLEKYEKIVFLAQEIVRIADDLKEPNEEKY